MKTLTETCYDKALPQVLESARDSGVTFANGKTVGRIEGDDAKGAWSWLGASAKPGEPAA